MDPPIQQGDWMRKLLDKLFCPGKKCGCDNEALVGVAYQAEGFHIFSLPKKSFTHFCLVNVGVTVFKCMILN